MTRFLRSSETSKDLGLLLLRIGIGGFFLVHGWPKLSAGPEVWEKLGGAMQGFGISFAPTFWGFMAAFAEFAAGLLAVLGLLTRPAAALLVINMVVALSFHFQHQDPFAKWSHAAESLVVWIAIFVAGAGRFSLDEMIFGGRRR